jgi:hypothetical protein
MGAGEKKERTNRFFHLPVAWWVISSNSTKTWSWWSTPEVLHKNHGVGVCSTVFLEQIRGGAAEVGRVWLKKFEAELVFLI